jgi:hypothetical protein
MVKNPKAGFEFNRAIANMDADRPCLETRRFWKGGGGSSAGHGPALSVSLAFLYLWPFCINAPLAACPLMAVGT